MHSNSLILQGLGNAADTVYGEFGDEPGMRQYVDAIAPNMVDTIYQQNAPGESMVDTALRIIPNIVATWQQKELMQIQLDRARAGLPPLDMSQYSGLGVNVGLSAGTQQMVLIGLAILAGAYLLPRMTGR